jgi:MOSC domain-containing protein YiiM
MHAYRMTLRHLVISPGHNYFGHPKGHPGAHPTHHVEQIELHAGQGIVGDRFYGKGAHFDGHVTFIAWEVVQLLRDAESATPDLVTALRRNVVTEGVPLNQLIGREFAMAGVHFRGVKHCAPCAWMTFAAGADALQVLRGRGGLRAQVLSDGILRRGPVLLTTDVQLDLTTITHPLPQPRLP